MTNEHDANKRNTLKLGGAGILAAGLATAAGSTREAHAQILDSGIDPKSVLANLKKEGVLRVGYSQTKPWFQKSAKTGKLTGIYFDVMEELAKALEIKAEYQEVSWSNATVGLRKGDFDVFGSSLFYTMPRALVVNYVGPMWRKGRLAVTHKDNAGRFKTSADFNKEDVTFSVNVGSSEENWVRAKKADLWATGDLDAILFARKNASWAHIIDRDNPSGLTANTWAIRYGDIAWKNFLDMWSDKMVTSGFMQERFDHYLDEIMKQ
jgi:ABC-type amino acid transport substrate-binding protein